MKNKKKKKEEEISVGITFPLIVKTFGIISLLIGFLYLGSVLFINKNSSSNNDDEETSGYIQYDEIVAGDIFNKTDSIYYVLIYDFNSQDVDAINYLLNSSGLSYVIYRVDLSNKFNSFIYSDVSNLNTTNINNFKVKETTLIKIKNGNLIDTAEGLENVMSYFD